MSSSMVTNISMYSRILEKPIGYTQRLTLTALWSDSPANVRHLIGQHRKTRVTIMLINMTTCKINNFKTTIYQN